MFSTGRQPQRDRFSLLQGPHHVLHTQLARRIECEECHATLVPAHKQPGTAGHRTLLQRAADGLLHCRPRPSRPPAPPACACSHCCFSPPRQPLSLSCLVHSSLRGVPGQMAAGTQNKQAWWRRHAGQRPMCRQLLLTGCRQRCCGWCRCSLLFAIMQQCGAQAQGAVY